jgi:hypothetical protein
LCSRGISDKRTEDVKVESGRKGQKERKESTKKMPGKSM